MDGYSPMGGETEKEGIQKIEKFMNVIIYDDGNKKVRRKSGESSIFGTA
jgi:hypothetical protein